MCNYVALHKFTDISNEYTASNFRVEEYLHTECHIPELSNLHHARVYTKRNTMQQKSKHTINQNLSWQTDVNNKKTMKPNDKNLQQHEHFI
jgi:hypothetical protein